MFSSPETDKKIRIINILLSIVAVVLFLFFCFTVSNDSTKDRIHMIQNMEKFKQEEEIQRQQIFQDTKAQKELEKRKETDSFFEKLDDGFDVKILVIGDEIGTGESASEKSKSWISLLSSKLESTYNVKVHVKNVSMSGNSSYAGYVRTKVLSDRVQYDLAIICYGQNDQNKQFQKQYESIIRAVRTSYDKCSIISVLESSQRDYTYKMKTIQDLAYHYGIFIADTIGPFNNGSYGKYESLTTDDKICPNDKGHQIYADTIYDIIDENVDANTTYTNENIEPLNKDVPYFDKLTPINARDFEKNGKNYTYTLSSPITGIVGIDYKYLTGKNGCRIFIDGKEYNPPEASPENEDFQLRILLVDDKPISISNSIEIKYDTQEQSNGFRGICISSENTDY